MFNMGLAFSCNNRLKLGLKVEQPFLPKRRLCFKLLKEDEITRSQVLRSSKKVTTEKHETITQDDNYCHSIRFFELSHVYSVDSLDHTQCGIKRISAKEHMKDKALL